MVVVTKIPDVESSQENIKLLNANLNVNQSRDLHQTATIIQPNQEVNNFNNSNLVPIGLKGCKELIQKAILEKNKVLLKENCDRLISQISIQTALDIFSFLNGISPINDEPSAPPSSDIDHDWMMIFQKCIGKSQEECLKIIEVKTDEVLMNFTDVLKLTYKDMMIILRRNTLNVPNEEFLYEMMYEWGKNRSNITGKSFRKTLGELPHQIRFGMMKLKSFKKLKGINEVLCDKDIRIIRFYLEEKAKERETHSLPNRWSEERTICTNLNDNRQVGTNRRLGRVGMYCLTCWMFVFD